jgi:hypothetical protein
MSICEVVLFFDDDSPDQATGRAMKKRTARPRRPARGEAAQPSKKRVVRGFRPARFHESEADADETA